MSSCAAATVTGPKVVAVPGAMKPPRAPMRAKAHPLRKQSLPPPKPHPLQSRVLLRLKQLWNDRPE